MSTVLIKVTNLALILSLFTFVSACNNQESLPLNIPDFQTVTKISISSSTSNNGFDWGAAGTITDSEQLVGILQFLKTLHIDRKLMFTPLPSAIYTIQIFEGNDNSMTLFLGNNSIGGVNRVNGIPSEPRLRALNKMEREKLLKLLGI